MPETLEALAALEHEQWVHWTKYLLDTLVRRYPFLADHDPDVRRWREQIATPYADLTEHEKDSDRFWARKAMATATDPVATALNREYRECCRRLANPDLANPLWWLGYRCGIEDLVARLAENGIAVPLAAPEPGRDR